jgi:anti-sigma B factor antagonist
VGTLFLTESKVHMPDFFAALDITTMEMGNERSVVKLQGELDVATAPRLDVRIRRLVEEGNTDIVIDLSEVTFIDSEGVVALLQARRHLAPVNGELLLTGPMGQVTSRGVALSGLDHVVRASIPNPG